MLILERDAEFAALDEALDAAVAGTGAALVVEGTAGIGKSALLDEARRRAAARGMRVQVATASLLERDLAHGVVRQLLEVAVRTATTGDRAALLAGAAELATPVVLPEAGIAADGAADLRGPIVHGLYWLTANLAAETPLLLAVDDAQWSDAASLRFLAYLARRLDGLPLVVLVTVRTGETSADPALADLAAGAAARVLRPEPLSGAAVEHLVRDCLQDEPDPEFAAACRQATGGVPFLLNALLDALAGGAVTPSAASAAAVTRVTSRTVGYATLLRLASMSAAALPVARYASVLGRHATVQRIAQLAGLDEAVVLRACDGLTTAHILRRGQPLAFVHPIVMSSIYDELAAGERSLAHAAAARLLSADGEPDEDVAAHLLATEPGTSQSTVSTLRAAARRALARGAPESAIAYLRRCAAEPPHPSDRAAVLHELARAESTVRDRNAATDLVRALELATEPGRRALIALDLVETWMFAGRWDAALAEVDRALAELDGYDRDVAGRLEVFRAGMIANDPRLVAEFERDRPRLTRLAEGGGRPARLMAALLASCAVCRIEPPAQVMALAVRGLDGSALMASEDADAWGPQAAGALAYLGELDRALAAADAMRDGARERGSVYGFVRATALRSLVDGLRGDLRASEADVRSAFDLSRDNELMFSTPPLLRWSIDALIERPHLADIVRAVEEIDLDPGLHASFSGAWFLEARGRLRLARGDRDAAREDLTRCGQMMTRLHVTNPIVSAWRSELALALPDTERDEARGLAEQEYLLAQATGLAHAQGRALRTVGMLTDGAERIAVLRQSADLLAGEPVELARTSLLLGVALRRAGHRSEGHDMLRAGLDRAYHSGAERCAARSEQELRAIGARPRRRASSGLASLTPSEARVAASAATGLTNREIAQELFVTSKTVENQLSRVYQKLGVRGRELLAEAIGSDGETS